MNVENKNLLPVITSENDVYPYLKKINQFPILTDEEEKKLAIESGVIRYLTVKYNKLDLKNEYFGEKKNIDEKKQKKTK